MASSNTHDISTMSQSSCGMLQSDVGQPQVLHAPWNRIVFRSCYNLWPALVSWNLELLFLGYHDRRRQDLHHLLQLLSPR